MGSKGVVVIALLPMMTPAGGAPPSHPHVLNVVIARNLMIERENDAGAKTLQSAPILIPGTVAALPVSVVRPRKMSEPRRVGGRRIEIEKRKRPLGWMTMSPMHLSRILFLEFRAMGWTSCNVGSKRRERKKCVRTPKQQQ